MDFGELLNWNYNKKQRNQHCLHLWSAKTKVEKVSFHGNRRPYNFQQNIERAFQYWSTTTSDSDSTEPALLAFYEAHKVDKTCFAIEILEIEFSKWGFGNKDLFLTWTETTMKLSKVSFRSRGSSLARTFCVNCGENRYLKFEDVWNFWKYFLNFLGVFYEILEIFY